jgi:hypothetical protein
MNDEQTNNQQMVRKQERTTNEQTMNKQGTTKG